MNLISETHHSCERREYAFMILREYTIISPKRDAAELPGIGRGFSNAARRAHIELNSSL